MNPIIEQFISGDKGAGYELMQAIAEAASTYNGPRVSLGSESPNEYPSDVRPYSQRAKARDVIQTRKGFVRFIF